jgi:hypothetical protein
MAAATAAAALGGAQTADAAVPRQSGSFTYTSTVPGTATGIVANFDFRNPENPNLKPHAAAKMVITTPVGGVIDTTVPPQCHASDGQLMAEGPAGCPPKTKVGGGFAVADTGGGGPFPRYSKTTISDFNNQGEVIGVGVNNDIPAIKSVDHTRIRGNTSTTEFPAFPGVPPPDPYTPFKRLHFYFPPYVRGGRAYDRTPPTCPATGYWTIRTSFIYYDGVSQTVRSSSPCRVGGSRGAPCLSRRSPIGPRNIGRIRLGASRRRLLELPVHTPLRSKARRSLRWCVKRSRGAVTAVLDRSSRATLVATTARGHGNRGVHPGSSTRALRAGYPGRRRLGRGLFSANARSRRVFGVRRGRVRYVAVASGRLLRTRRSLRRTLRRARL